VYICIPRGNIHLFLIQKVYSVSFGLYSNSFLAFSDEKKQFPGIFRAIMLIMGGSLKILLNRKIILKGKTGILKGKTVSFLFFIRVFK
jgi:hypothetical protein